ncbi:MAG: thiamine phosphate synthase [Candidatus Phaeomarinobacter sp.]
MGDDTKAALHTIARLADRQFGPRRRTQLPNLLVMTDRGEQGHAQGIIEAVPAGTIVCLRDYEMPDRWQYAAQLARSARQHSIRFVVAGDIRLAMQVGAWGVHIPEDLWRDSIRHLGTARRLGLRVSTAVHSAKAAAAVSRRGPVLCDYATVSPVFPTHSHPGAKTLGALGLSRILGALDVPAYALGGINQTTIANTAGLPLAGIAGIRFS